MANEPDKIPNMVMLIEKRRPGRPRMLGPKPRQITLMLGGTLESKIARLLAQEPGKPIAQLLRELLDEAADRRLSAK